MKLFTRRAARLGARLRSRLRAMTFRSLLENEMDAELRFHLESYVEDLVERGMTRDAAERQARVEFGGIAVHKEEMRASLGLRLWDDLRADLLYAMRMLWKSPGFTAIAVGSLALGIGANTAIFTVAKAVLLDRLHVPHSEELLLFHWIAPKQSVVHHSWGDWDTLPGNRQTSTSFPYPVYQQLRAHNQALQDLFAFKGVGQLTATVDGEAGVVQGEMVSGNYYRELDVQTSLGRPLGPADDATPGSGAVVVISDSYWAKQFARSPSVVGKVLYLNSKLFTIVGVNPPGFTGAKNAHASPEVFVPFSIQPVLMPRGQGTVQGSILDDSQMWWMQIMARRKSDFSVQTAVAALNVQFASIVRAGVKIKKGEAIPQIVLADGSRGLNESARYLTEPVYVLTALAGLVLLLACANIANLLLARSSARQREMSVRLALGASRGRILRQVFTESVTLSLLGGAAGFVLGFLGRNAIPHLMSSPWEPLPVVGGFDWGVFGFTASVSILTGLLFGLAPAWKATRTQVNSSLKDNAQTTTHRRRGFAGKVIVTFQVALSTLLVVGAVLFARTLANLDSVDPGFRADHLLLFAIQQPRSQYPVPKDVTLHRELEQKLATVPGVESVTLSSGALIANNIDEDDFTPLDRPNSKKEDTGQYNSTVGEHFFATMGIPVLAGRDFNAGDTETSPKVAVINLALAHAVFPGENPIGKRFRSSNVVFQIVGVCVNTHYDSLRKEPPPTFYLPYRQLPGVAYGMTYEVRTNGNPTSLVPLLRRAVQSVDKNLPLIDVRTQEQQIAATVRDERMFADLTAAFGLLALTLASIGIYGIMAYTVSRRTNEIGIRLALGAQARQILSMVLGEAFWLAAAGVAAGLGAALFLTRFLRTMLYGLKPNDPATLVCAATLLFAVALLAGWVPARRASRVQPMQALRHE
jgi:predicted permease